MRGKELSMAFRALAIFTVTLFVTSSWAATNWREKVLHNFGSGTDGLNPWAGLISDAAGNLYGTTRLGGAYTYGGTVFELSPSGSGGWTETVLHSFGNGTDGLAPYASLIFDAAGNLYGTTYGGGTHGYGIVFELSPAAGGGWTETILYSFANNADGAYPYASLIFDAAGNLYGTTIGGGLNNCNGYFGTSCGTVFKLSPAEGGGWTEKVLYSFAGSIYADGAYPYASLILDAAGNLYGTTITGGLNNCDSYLGTGCGTVFELSPNEGGEWTETVLHNFNQNGTDGYYSLAGLIFDAVGNLYGTTSEGGPYGDGTVFELSPTIRGGWTETVLYSFCSQNDCSDGNLPSADLIFDASGSLYGTTQEGGAMGYGTVFEVSPSEGGGWMERVLHSFGGAKDGQFPGAGLIFDASGSLYGTTLGGGVYNDGTVFELTPVYSCITCSHAGLR